MNFINFKQQKKISNEKTTFVCKSNEISVFAGFLRGNVADFNVISARDVFVLLSSTVPTAKSS